MYFTEERNRDFAQTLFKHVREKSTELVDNTFEYEMRVYSDPDIAAAERERIFQRKPMMALHASQLPAADSFVTVSLNRSSVLVTRRQDGRVRAFLNICRHRGAPVVQDKAGTRARFVCPYHGWAYDNRGTLQAITFQRTTGLSPCDERNLIELPAEERHGFVWIVEDPHGTIDVARHLGPDMDGALGEYGLETWHLYREHVYDFPQNWKIMIDGLLDGYHVQFVHGATISSYFYPNMLGRLPMRGDHMLYGNPRKSIDRILDEEPGASALDNHVVFANLVMPNSSIVLHPQHIEFWTLYQHPDGPHRSLTHLRYLTRDKDHSEESMKRLDRNWKLAEAAIVKEDVPVGNSIQVSAASPHSGTIVLGRNEIANQQFHRAYRRYMEQD